MTAGAEGRARVGPGFLLLLLVSSLVGSANGTEHASETISMCMSGTVPQFAFFFPAPRFVYLLEALDEGEYREGRFASRGTLVRPADPAESVRYNVTIETIRGDFLAEPITWEGNHRRQEAAVGDYLSHLGALREKAVAFTDPFFQERLDKSQGSHYPAGVSDAAESSSQLPNSGEQPPNSTDQGGQEAGPGTQEGQPKPGLETYRHVVPMMISEGPDNLHIRPFSASVGDGEHAAAHEEDSLHEGPPAVDSSEASPRVFVVAEPQHGFYHHKDLTSNAGATFHDMLLNRAQQTERTSHAVPPLFPHLLDAATSLYGSVFPHVALHAHSISLRLQVMFCRYAVTLFPWSNSSLERAAEAMEQVPEEERKMRRPSILRHQAPGHDAPYVSDILYGDRLDVSIVLKSAHADLHHAKHDVALAFNKLLSRTTTHENFTARFGDMMAEGWLAWADEGEVLEEEEAHWHALDQTFVFRVYTDAKQADRSRVVVWFGPCRLPALLLALDQFEFRATHGAKALLGEEPGLGARFFGGEVLGVYSTGTANHFLPFYITQCAAGALPPAKVLLIMSRFSFFSTMSVAALTSIFIYLLVGKILHVMSLTQPRLQRVIGVRTLSMTYYLPFLWLPGIWSMLSGSAPPAATATTAASPQENAARAGQQQTTGGNGAAPRPPPRSFFEYLMHGAGEVIAFFLEPDPFDESLLLPPFQRAGTPIPPLPVDPAWNLPARPLTPRPQHENHRAGEVAGGVGVGEDGSATSRDHGLQQNGSVSDSAQAPRSPREPAVEPMLPSSDEGSSTSASAGAEEAVVSDPSARLDTGPEPGSPAGEREGGDGAGGTPPRSAVDSRDAAPQPDSAAM